MTLKWTGWIADPSAIYGPVPTDIEPASGFLSPYADWFLNTEPRERRDSFRFLPQERDVERAENALHDIVLPSKAFPPGATEITPPGDRPDPLGGLNVTLQEQDMIIGVIDEGLAPAHERFRRKGGVGSRVLSLWQQGGTWDASNPKPHLPFGREIMQKQIDAAMGPTSQVDEAAFARKAGLVDFGDPIGDRWTELRASHGMAVADLVAGCDPMAPGGPLAETGPMARLRDRAHLLMVEIAPRASIGPSGSFLESQVIWAVRHIVNTADALWQARFGMDDSRSFPVVINLSFGLQAGPKDGNMMVQRIIRKVLADRPRGKPVRLVLPAGNDNLERGTAKLRTTRKEEPRAITWRIRPEDRTSSYCEVWNPLFTGTGDADMTHPQPISLTTPGGVSGPGTAGRAGQMAELRDDAATSGALPLARIYCRRHVAQFPDANGDLQDYHRLAYVICVGPTWRVQGVAAPSGAWTITLGGGGPLFLYVQSDLNLRPGSTTSLLSYFDDPNYETHDIDTRLRDTYRFCHLDRVARLSDSPGPVQRRNSLNTMAGSSGILTVAGYRGSDGWPVDYSSSGRGYQRGGGGPEPDLAALSDDGIWRYGRMAAGARSGSTVVLQGTSFAAPEAARGVAMALLDWLDNGSAAHDPADNAAMQARARIEDAAGVTAERFAVPAADLALKIGQGRLAPLQQGRPAR